MKKSDHACLCVSGKAFSKCCARFLIDGQHAKTPEQLMRSRYAAFALGGFGDYLLKTWSPAKAQGINAEDLSVKSVEWNGLEVIAKSQKGDVGRVEFKAYFLREDGGQACHHEDSDFERVDGKWFYLSGNIFQD